MAAYAELARNPQHASARATERSAVATNAIGEKLNARPAVVAQRAAAAQLSARGTPNRTGLPDRLKAGVEALSGVSMDDVRVHRNSAEPAQMQAHAFAQGADIHLAPGQEQHLPHEAWHVVQQKQGRVHATRQMKSGVAINDDSGLEAEADAMGARAAGLTSSPHRLDALDTGNPSAASLRSIALPHVTQRIGKVASTALGALGGGLLGFMAGGPMGAAALGVAGAVAGYAYGDEAQHYNRLADIRNIKHLATADLSDPQKLAIANYCHRRGTNTIRGAFNNDLHHQFNVTENGHNYVFDFAWDKALHIDLGGAAHGAVDTPHLQAVMGLDKIPGRTLAHVTLQKDAAAVAIRPLDYNSRNNAVAVPFGSVQTCMNANSIASIRHLVDDKLTNFAVDWARQYADKDSGAAAARAADVADGGFGDLFE